MSSARKSGTPRLVGHIGVRLVPLVLERIRQATSTIIFTNTRAQAEIWYRALVLAAPDLLTEIALHHGSLERELRIVWNRC